MTIWRAGARFTLNTSFMALTLTASSFAFSRPAIISGPTRQDADSAIPRLTRDLDSSDEEKRRNAVQALALLQTPAAAPALVAALNDKSERVRAQAVTGLGNLGDAAPVPAVAARLTKDKSVLVRKSAAYALGRLGSREGTAALLAALKDKNVEVRGAAAVALGQYQDASAIEALIRALSDKADFVRAEAARALSVNGSRAAPAVPLLLKMLSSDDYPEARRQAAVALGRIGERSALPALEAAKFSPDPYLSQAALAAIERLNGERLGSTE